MTISWFFLLQFSYIFVSELKRKRSNEKGLTREQWINLHSKNRSVELHKITGYEKNWTYDPSASGSYEKKEEVKIDEIQMDLKILIILHRLNYY